MATSSLGCLHFKFDNEVGFIEEFQDIFDEANPLNELEILRENTSFYEISGTVEEMFQLVKEKIKTNWKFLFVAPGYNKFSPSLDCPQGQVMYEHTLEAAIESIKDGDKIYFQRPGHDIFLLTLIDRLCRNKEKNIKKLSFIYEPPAYAMYGLARYYLEQKNSHTFIEDQQTPQQNSGISAWRKLNFEDFRFHWNQIYEQHKDVPSFDACMEHLRMEALMSYAHFGGIELDIFLTDKIDTIGRMGSKIDICLMIDYNHNNKENINKFMVDFNTLLSLRSPFRIINLNTDLMLDNANGKVLFSNVVFNLRPDQDYMEYEIIKFLTSFITETMEQVINLTKLIEASPLSKNSEEFVKEIDERYQACLLYIEIFKYHIFGESAALDMSEIISNPVYGLVSQINTQFITMSTKLLQESTREFKLETIVLETPTSTESTIPFVTSENVSTEV